MKRIANLLYLIICFFVITPIVGISCSDDSNEKINTNSHTENNNQVSFLGKVLVSGGYEKENVKVDVTFLENNKITIKINKAQFSSQMPMALDIEWREVPYIQEGENITFAQDSIIPFAMNGYMTEFTCYNVTGSITGGNSLSLSFTCRSMGASFSGTKSNN